MSWTYHFSGVGHRQKTRLLLPLTAALAFLLAAANTGEGMDTKTSGPTVQLGCDAVPSPAADFMYFIPLISPEPVARHTSPGCTQAVRVLSCKCRASSRSFSATCEMQLEGKGWEENIFDLSPIIRRHKGQLQKGAPLRRQLKSIDVKGAGSIAVEVRGAVTNGVRTVNEVSLHFNARGHASPVWIDLCDISRSGDKIGTTNEMVAQVNTLVFRRKPGKPTMEVSVASVKHKDAGDGAWANFKGGLTGLAVNMFIPPLEIQAVGHEAMLDFGQALTSGATSFTFPRSPNLQ